MALPQQFLGVLLDGFEYTFSCHNPFWSIYFQWG